MELLASGYGLVEGPRVDAHGGLYFSDVHGGGVFHRSPDGRIDTLAAEQLDQVLQAAVEAGNSKIVVDMSKVEYISSAGLRSLAAVLVKCRGEGGDLKLAALNERVTRVFKIIGFDLLMSVTDTPEAAIADFSTGAAS